MRFSKRVKIGKGLNMNLSKSGIGMSIGGSGLSMSYGKNGLYLNSGIPGTGISGRHKIGAKNSYNNRSDRNAKIDTQISIEVKLDDNNTPQIFWNMDDRLPNGIIAKKGQPIYDEEVLREIKKNPIYKQLLKEAAEEKVEEVNLRTKILTEVFKESPKIITHDELEMELNKINSPEYLSEYIQLNEPKEFETFSELESEAKEKISSIFFWNNKKNRKIYVDSNFEPRHKTKKDLWEDTLNNTKKDLNAIIEDIEQRLKGNADYIKSAFEKFLQDTQLPLEFYVDYEYSENDKKMKLDLDLPEIEDMPLKQAVLTSTSRFSLREKSQKQIQEEYARCVLGFGFYLAANTFNISPIINLVQISGYTQRVSAQTGNQEDQYVYSIVFQGSKISSLNIETLDPINAIENFEHKINMAKNFQMTQIEPIK